MNYRRSLILAIVLLTPVSAGAADHFLTIGGGSWAANNQVSLEKNVLYLQRFLAERGMGDVPHEILFADGKGGLRDLVYEGPDGSVPKAVEMVARVLGGDENLYQQYRPHDIPHLWGSSNRASINKWFDTIGKQLNDGDRLVIYYTGHGGKGSTLAMWSENDMPAKEFAGLLDKLPAKVSVVLVMVQCFSGGFADMIYEGGDPAKGLSKRDRCGFFATVSDRVAAGCTSDVDEENYREYSTYFWAALYGQTRTGQPVTPPDFDKDGRVSLSEAHGYTLVNSDTIDISVKTSDALLRKYSKTKPASAEMQPGVGTAGSRPAASARSSASSGVDVESSLDVLHGAAKATDRAVLASLAKQLNLKAEAPVKSARAISEEILKQQRKLDTDMGAARRRHGDARRNLRGVLLTRWPELTNFLHPKAAVVMREDADAIVKAVESAPQFKDLEKAEAEVGRIDTEKMNLDRKWAKIQRFVRVAENVALASNLSDVAPPDAVEKYNALIASEAGTLGAPPPLREASRAGANDAMFPSVSSSSKRVEAVGCEPLGRHKDD